MCEPVTTRIILTDLDMIKLAMKEASARLRARGEETPLLDFFIDKLEKDYRI